MNYHVVDVRQRATNLLLDLARPRMCLVESAGRVEAERQEGDEPGIGAEEAELARLGARQLVHDPAHVRLAPGAHLARRAALGERLEVRLHAGDLGDR